MFNCRLRISLCTLFFSCLFAFLAGLAGCNSNAGSVRPFIWNTERPVPHVRDECPITWYGTDERTEVIEQARSTGRPILCYVSRYEDYSTEEIEEDLFAADMWGEMIEQNFVTWEVDWWEDPILAQYLLTGDWASGGLGLWCWGPPALVVLQPSGDPDSDELLLVDTWTSTDVYYFPGHSSGQGGTVSGPAISPLSSEGRAELNRLLTSPGSTFPPVRVHRGFGGDPYENVKDYIDMHKDFLDGSGLIAPEYILCLALEEMGSGDDIKGLELEMIGWVKDEYSLTADVWLGEMNFAMPHSGQGYGGFTEINIVRNLMAAASASALDEDWPVEPETLFDALYNMVVLEDGRLGGGFPTILDTMNTFEEFDLEDMDLSPLILFSPNAVIDMLDAFDAPVPGTRDVVWVNARTLAWWLKLVKWDPSLESIVLSDGVRTGELLDTLAPSMLAAMEQRINLEHPDTMRLADRIYMLDLLIEMYQTTGDVALLEKAGSIADSFPADSPDEWYHPSANPMLFELAVSLYRYGWLAHEEGPRDTASLITDTGLTLSSWPTGSLEEVQLIFAIDVIDSKCIHVAVVASLDDPMGDELLKAALEGWDPRKVAQILDPERDAELIEQMGYVPMEDAVAFVCLDDSCYPPVRDPEELREMLAEVQADLADNERLEGSDSLKLPR